MRDLADIWAYIAEDSPAHADRYIDLLDKKFSQLARHPRTGRARPELFAGLRSFPLGSYVIFYLSPKSGIEIVRVLHGARDVEALFDTE